MMSAGTAAPDSGTVLTRRERISLVVLVVLTFICVGVVSVFYVTHKTARIDGPSMEPTLQQDDLVLLTRGYDAPLRGDVIVLQSTGQEGMTEDLVKRVIAIPGDEVEMEDGVAYVNGSKEQGSYTVYVSPDDYDIAPYVVPEGTVFVLGDNRTVSFDSRYLGPIPIGSVVGEVLYIIGPLERATTVD